MSKNQDTIPAAGADAGTGSPRGDAAGGGGPEHPAPLAVSLNAAQQAVVGEVSRWEGVSVHDHRMGGVELRLGRRELGHLHGAIADLPFPRRLRDELVLAGRARPHHVVPDSGWITVPMRTASELANVIELFRQNYERSTRPATPAASSQETAGG